MWKAVVLGARRRHLHTVPPTPGPHPRSASQAGAWLVSRTSCGARTLPPPPQALLGPLSSVSLPPPPLSCGASRFRPPPPPPGRPPPVAHVFFPPLHLLFGFPPGLIHLRPEHSFHLCLGNLYASSSRAREASCIPSVSDDAHTRAFNTPLTPCLRFRAPLSLAHVVLLTFAICPCHWVQTARVGPDSVGYTAGTRCGKRGACVRHRVCVGEAA